MLKTLIVNNKHAKFNIKPIFINSMIKPMWTHNFQLKSNAKKNIIPSIKPPIKAPPNTYYLMIHNDLNIKQYIKEQKLFIKDFTSDVSTPTPLNL